jgi:type IV pilus assembly protein PilE
MDRNKGFTLIEIMIVVAIIGILASIALPAYQDSVSKSRRGDAMGALASFSNAMAQWYVQNSPPSYLGAASGGGDTGSPQFFSTNVPIDGGTATYNLTIQSATQTTYRLRATPVGAQVGDGFIEIDQQGGQFWDEDNSGGISSSENTWDP